MANDVNTIIIAQATNNVNVRLRTEECWIANLQNIQRVSTLYSNGEIVLLQDITSLSTNRKLSNTNAGIATRHIPDREMLRNTHSRSTKMQKRK